MPAIVDRDSILVVGASGRTGSFVVRYLSAASVPVIACVRRPPAEAQLGAAEYVVADLARPASLAPFLDRAAHVIYVAGSPRKSLSAGAWQLEIDALSVAIELARRSGFAGRWIYVGYSGPQQGSSASWEESRWRELKLEAEEVITSSSLNYFVLSTGRVTEAVREEPRVAVTQSSGQAKADLPCNVLAFLLTGVAMAGATHRARATVRLDPGGMRLQAAVNAFSRLRADVVGSGAAGALRANGALGRH